MTRPRRGVALIVVLWTILLLVSITAVASSASRASADVAVARRAQSVARAMAESGIVAGVARIEGLLRAPGDSVARTDRLAALLAPGGDALAADTLDDGVFAVTAVDVSARLDVNAAGAEGWERLLSPFAGPVDARRIARAIDARVVGAPTADESSRDSLEAALLGRTTPGGFRRPFETLEELLDIPGLSPALLARVAPLLTVDGDGRINRRAAPAAVLAAATGSLVDAPSRVLLIARGWQRGAPLTREIEAVYDLADDGLRLVRWRERDR